MVTALALGAPVHASVEGPLGAGDAPDPLIKNVTGWTKATPTASTTAAPHPDAADGIGPGSMLLMYFQQGGDPEDTNVYLCTANFLWGDGSSVYLGAAGHCFMEDPETPVMPDRVEVCVSNCGLSPILKQLRGAFETLGKVAFASARPDSDPNAPSKDFGVVEVPTALHRLLRATVPVWGGPSSANQASPTAPGCLYGNGIGYGETFAGKARAGAFHYVDEQKGTWQALGMPISFGDSGSAVVVCDPGDTGRIDRRPIGVVTHITVSARGGTATGPTVKQAKALAAAAGLNLELLIAPPVANPSPPVNRPPDAQDDTAKTRVNRSVTIAVLANDSDPDGDALTISSVTSPSNGTATLNPDQTITYTPATDFVGQDSFTYTVRDPGGLEDTASVAVEVTQKGGGGGNGGGGKGGGGKGGGKP